MQETSNFCGLAKCGTFTRNATNEVQILNKHEYVKRSNKTPHLAKLLLYAGLLSKN
jgi:hypothetical protein